MTERPTLQPVPTIVKKLDGSLELRVGDVVIRTTGITMQQAGDELHIGVGLVTADVEFATERPTAN